MRLGADASSARFHCDWNLQAPISRRRDYDRPYDMASYALLKQTSDHKAKPMPLLIHNLSSSTPYDILLYFDSCCTKLVRANWAPMSPGSSTFWLAAHMNTWRLYLMSTRRYTRAPLKTPSRASLVEIPRGLFSSLVSSEQGWVCLNFGTHAHIDGLA